MRFVVFAAVCLCMAILASANDLSEGSRKEGDVLVRTERLYRPSVPGKQMIAKIGYHTDGEITVVSAVNAEGSDATVTIAKGGLGQHYVLVTAVSQAGSGLDVQVDIYATKSRLQSEESTAA